MGSIYHAGLYLGRGWFIHSTGSSDGVTLQSLSASSYYKSMFAWGRRVLKPSELVVVAVAVAVAVADGRSAGRRAGADAAGVHGVASVSTSASPLP